MEEEIKDILELLRDGVKRPVVTLSKYSLDNICELNPNECKKLLEYIENLQSQLKAKEEVIKEAREYIRSNNIEVLKYHDIPSETASYEIVTVDLLKILSKGENK